MALTREKVQTKQVIGMGPVSKRPRIEQVVGGPPWRSLATAASGVEQVVRNQLDAVLADDLW